MAVFAHFCPRIYLHKQGRIEHLSADRGTILMNCPYSISPYALLYQQHHVAHVYAVQTVGGCIVHAQNL